MIEIWKRWGKAGWRSANVTRALGIWGKTIEWLDAISFKLVLRVRGKKITLISAMIFNTITSPALSFEQLTSRTTASSSSFRRIRHSTKLQRFDGHELHLLQKENWIFGMFTLNDADVVLCEVAFDAINSWFCDFCELRNEHTNWMHLFFFFSWFSMVWMGSLSVVDAISSTDSKWEKIESKTI